MKYLIRLSPLLATFILFTTYSPAQSTAAEEMHLGILAFRNAKYEEATRHFEKCVALSPDNSDAHLYLATAYAEQYIPGAETPDNSGMAEKAIEQYRYVLNLDAAPSARANSTKGIAYLYLQMKKFDDSKNYYRSTSDLDPDDPESYYAIAVIDWTLCYQFRQEQRAKLGMKPDDSLPLRSKKVCAEVRERNSATVEEAINKLTKALQLRPDYDDAMAYMNLMYHERADIQCDDPAASAADLKTADEWVDKTLAIKKAKAEKSWHDSATPPTNHE